MRQLDARALYEASDNQVKPTWDQIGEVTKSVWREYAMRPPGPDRFAVILQTPPQRRFRAATPTEKPKMDYQKISELFDQISEAAAALSATFSAEGGDGGDKAVNGKAAKPAVRAGHAPKVAKASKPAATDDSLDEDTVREKLKELVEAKGSDALLEAFATVGAGKLADVDESQYRELVDAAQALIDAEEEEPAPAKMKAKGKPKGPTLEQVQEAASALIEADKPAYMKLVKKLGKPSEMDADDYAAAIAAYEAAMPEADDPEGLL